MKLKKKYSEIFYFVGIIDALDLKENTKVKELVGIALRSISKEVIVDYNDKVEGLRIKHCAEDKDSKIILKDKDGKYEFTKDGTTAFRKELKDLGETKVEFNLTQFDKKELDGLDVPSDIVDSLVEFGFLTETKK
jgi:hypothetical protein